MSGKEGEEHPPEQSLDPFSPGLLLHPDTSLLFSRSVPAKQNSDPLWILVDNTNVTWRHPGARAAIICKQQSWKHLESCSASRRFLDLALDASQLAFNSALSLWRSKSSRVGLIKRVCSALPPPFPSHSHPHASCRACHIAMMCITHFRECMTRCVPGVKGPVFNVTRHRQVISRESQTLLVPIKRYGAEGSILLIHNYKSHMNVLHMSAG